MRELNKRDSSNQWLRAHDLRVVWEDAQRGYLDEAKVNEIINNFDPDYFGAILVSALPDNRYHVIDGHHRTEAVRRLFGGNELVPCIVVSADNKARAAEIFVAVNGQRSRPSPVAMFIANVTAKRAAETEINQAVRMAGYRIESYPAAGTIRAVAALLAIHKQHGIETVRGALSLIKQTWGNDAAATDGAIIRGFALLHAEHAKELNQTRLARVLAKKYTPERLIGSAKAAKDMFSVNLAEAVKRLLIQAYDSGLATGRLDKSEKKAA